jgi:TPR repeat protein
MRCARRAIGVRVLALLGLLALAPASAQVASPPLETLEPRAEAGDAEAQYQLALRHLHGRGISRDLADTARWLGRAADQGHLQARERLNELMAGRFARPGDADALLEIYRERARAGDAIASTKLGLSYRDGVGVDPDDREALRWLEAGAEKGDVEAFAALGSMHDEGRGVPRDRIQAAGWFRRAAERGHAGAQFALGSMLVQGDGVPKQVPEGLMWLELCRDTERSARYLLFRLEGELDPAQLAEGRARAATWRSARGLAPASQPAPGPVPAAAPLPEPL